MKTPSKEQMAFLFGRRDRLAGFYLRAETGDADAKRDLPAEAEAYEGLYAETYDRCRECHGTLGGPLPPEPVITSSVIPWILWDLRRRGYCESCASMKTNDPPQRHGGTGP